MRAARAARVDLAVVDVPSEEIRELYEADLVLIRPDQIVAWRGTDESAAAETLAYALGHRA